MSYAPVPGEGLEPTNVAVRREALAAELTGRNGREGGTRTRDLLYPKQVALLLAHSPWSGRSDLNRRSPASKTGALA